MDYRLWGKSVLGLCGVMRMWQFGGLTDVQQNPNVETLESLGETTGSIVTYICRIVQKVIPFEDLHCSLGKTH